MASANFSNLTRHLAKGDIDFDVNTFKVLLVTALPSEANLDSWVFRSDIANEVANGNGYTTGGKDATLTWTLNTTAHTLTITVPQLVWTTSTFTARYLVCRKARGGLASADELAFYLDFGADVSPTAGSLTVNSSTLTINSPAP